MNVNESTPPSMSPSEWSNLLKASQPPRGKGAHQYIVLKNEHGNVQPGLSPGGKKIQKMPVAEIVHVSRACFDKAKGNLAGKEHLTRAQVNEFQRLSSDIIHNTDLIIQARISKRGQLIKKLGRLAAFVFSAALVPLFGLGLHLIGKIRNDTQKFEEEMQALKDNVQAMVKEKNEMREHKFNLDKALLQKLDYDEKLIPKLLGIGEVNELMDRLHELTAKMKELKAQEPLEGEKLQEFNQLLKQWEEVEDELKSYVINIQKAEEELNMPFNKAAQYVHLRKSFLEVQMPILTDPEYASSIKENMSGVFNTQLSAFYQIDPKKRPPVIDQFKSDMERHVTFERVEYDSSTGKPVLQDATPLPQPNSSDKVEDAAQAISEIVGDDDKAWLPILQLAVTQIGLNEAFSFSRVTLAASGGQLVSWKEGDEDFVVASEFSSEGLPPIKLEVTRTPTGMIEEVHVIIEGSLDLVKKNIGNKKTPSGQIVAPPKDRVIVPDAFQTSLSFSIRLGEGGKPVISGFKCENRANTAI